MLCEQIRFKTLVIANRETSPLILQILLQYFNFNDFSRWNHE